MKKLFLMAAVAVLASVSYAAKTFSLQNGLNEVNGCGEIVGIECITVGATQSVTASVVNVVCEYTNAVVDVVSKHDIYSFTITNYDGNASIATNVLDRFSYSDWVTQGGYSKIISPVVHGYTNVTMTVDGAPLLKAQYSTETAIKNGTAANHYLLLTPAATMNFYGGKFKIQCGSQDRLTLLLK